MDEFNDGHIITKQVGLGGVVVPNHSNGGLFLLRLGGDIHRFFIFRLGLSRFRGCKQFGGGLCEVFGAVSRYLIYPPFVFFREFLGGVACEQLCFFYLQLLI